MSMKKSALLTVFLAVVAAICVIAAFGVWVRSVREEGEANRRARIEQQRAEEKAQRDAMFEKVLGQ